MKVNKLQCQISSPAKQKQRSLKARYKIARQTETNLKENPPKLRALLLIIWRMNACFSV